ncbi:MAG: hypothetical protein IT285_09765, partial [Bdellovibrionales bacterium]|nr:hypothetical protein [Bdellovibrionales bacterium]
MSYPGRSIIALGLAVFAGLILALVRCGSGITDGLLGGESGALTFKTFQAAEFVLGQTAFNLENLNNGSSVSATGLFSPLGSMGVLKGRLYVADQSNQRVVGYALESLATGMSATVVVGQTLMTGSNPGLDAQGLTFPRSVAVDTERLIVIDSGNGRALGYSADSLELPPPVAADTPYGDNDLNGPGGANCVANELSTPLGAVVAGTRLLVADSLNHRVSVWNDYINQGAGASADL